jgi:hypothetical protein
MANNSRTIVVKFAGDAKGLKKTTQDSRRDIEGWGAGLGKFAAGAAAAVATVAVAVGATALTVGKDLYDLSNRIKDLDAKSRAVFGDQLADVQKWAEANRRAFGMSSREVVGLAANLADLLKPMGFTTKQAVAMSKKMLDLAGALAKWSGGTRTASEVSDILVSAMLGERDALKGLGISISQAEVDARVATMSTKKMTEAEKARAEALATQQLIFEKSTDAQAAWANGGKAAAEAQGRLQSSIQTTKEKLAVLLTPAFDAATVAIGKFAEQASTKFDELAPKVQNFVKTELGDLTSALTHLKDDTLAGLKSGFDDVSTSVDQNADSWRKLDAALTHIVEVSGPGVKFLLEQMGKGIANTLNGLALVIQAFDWLIRTIGSAIDKLIIFLGLAHSKVDAQWVPPRGTQTFGAAPGRRASGGPVSAFRDYWVGENGPELLRMGARSGTVIPHQQAVSSSWSAGPTVIENHIHIGDEVVRVVRTELSRDKRSTTRAVLAGAGAR